MSETKQNCWQFSLKLKNIWNRHTKKPNHKNSFCTTELGHTLPLFLLQYLHKYGMVQTKYRRLPEYKEIQNPVDTSHNQQKIKLAANGDYDITNRMRITEIFI